MFYFVGTDIEPNPAFRTLTELKSALNYYSYLMSIETLTNKQKTQFNGLDKKLKEVFGAEWDEMKQQAAKQMGLCLPP